MNRALGEAAEAAQVNQGLQELKDQIRRQGRLSLTDALAAAARAKLCRPDPQLGKTPQLGPQRCNYFVGAAGAAADIPYFRDILGNPHPDHRRANDLYDFIKHAVKSSASGWREVPPVEARDLANRGKFVVVVARSIDPNDHGHVAIVAPDQLPTRGTNDKTRDRGYPFVRDSKNSLLSERANYVFTSLSGKAKEEGLVKEVEPIWAVWDPGLVPSRR